MALVTRAVGVWRGMSASCSGPRVVCGVEPTRKSQQALSHSDNTSSNLSRRLSISSSGDAALRCQAATLTAVRETTEVEMRGLEESRAALRGSFEAVSVSGCEECRPDSQVEDRFLGFAMAETGVEVEQGRLYYGRRGGGDGFVAVGATAKVVEETPVMGKAEMLASFEAALHEAGRNAELVAGLASRAWRVMGDADRAEALFLKALEWAPQDSAIHASYAEFLWQCDA